MLGEQAEELIVSMLEVAIGDFVVMATKYYRGAQTMDMFMEEASDCGRESNVVLSYGSPLSDTCLACEQAIEKKTQVSGASLRFRTQACQLIMYTSITLTYR